MLFSIRYNKLSLLRQTVSIYNKNSMTCVHTKTPHRKNAAALTIGDEILTGKTLDTNAHHLAKTCFTHGLDLQRMVTVPDVKETISETVRQLSSTFDYVFTSGGIGPTHDDITYESIAEAFRLPLVYHKPTLKRMAAYFAAKKPPVPLTEARRRMALFPDIQGLTSEVIYVGNADYKSKAGELTPGTLAKSNSPDAMTTKPPNARNNSHHLLTRPNDAMSLDTSPRLTNLDSKTKTSPSPLMWVPIVRVKNVYILPGVPTLYRALVDALFQEYLQKDLIQKPLHRKRIGMMEFEGDVADTLSQVQAQLKSRGVRIGSYPQSEPLRQLQGNVVRVVVTLEGEDEQAIDSGVGMILASRLRAVVLTDETS